LNDTADSPQPVILLGASNLTIGWRHLLRALQGSVPGALELHVALGMGRSYVGWSRFWWRTLPGIVDCGLWQNLPQENAQSPLVLITDIGNDIVYGHRVDTILESVDKCISKILTNRPDSQIVITGLPVASLEAVPRSSFLLARSAFFPNCFLPRKEILTRAHQLHEGTQELAARHKLPCVVPPAEWYRHDPIHVLRELRESAFRHYFAHWKIKGQPSAPPSADYAATVGLPTSALRTVYGITRRTPQPGFQAEGIAVSAW
jgi:hypothetical protein